MELIIRLFSIVLLVVIIRIVTPYLKNFLGKYSEVIEQRKAKEKLPSWERGLTFMLFLFFFISLIILTAPYSESKPNGEIKSGFELILLLLSLITFTVLSGLLSNIMLWLMPFTRKTIEETGLTFKKANSIFIKVTLIMVPITLIYYIVIRYFNL